MSKEQKGFLMNFLKNNKNEKTTIRLANEIQSDNSVSISKTQGDAVKFLDGWLDTIDSDWFQQCYKEISSIGTFWDFSQRGMPV